MTRYLCAALLAACASSAAAQNAPEPLPLSAFVDSAALHDALRAAKTPPFGTGRDRLLFRVSYDTAGALEGVESLACRPPPGPYQNEIAALVRAHARPQLETRERHHETLLVHGGPRPRLEIARDRRELEVHPVLANRKATGDTMAAVGRRLAGQKPELVGRSFAVDVLFRISKDGVTGEARPVTPSGIPEVDETALRVVRAMRFRPATVDGCPVEVLVELPIVLNPRR